MLPVLPALLSASATGGRRRPLGIVLGLAVAIPRFGDRLEAPLSRLARFGPKSGGRGFWSGILVGAALGFVYAPCAGPVLAAVISVSAASGRTVVIGLAYALGSSIVLLVLALAGRRLTVRLRGPALSRVLGTVMVLTAVALAFQLDIRFQTAIANHLPAAVVNPTNSLETSAAVSDRLAKLRPASPYASKAAAAGGADLEDFGQAPEFTGNDRWFNSKPLTLAGLKGRVVLVDFWTYTCINCIRTLPHLVAWDKAYRDAGLTIVGVHSPEFSFEKKASNVARALKQNGIEYPVAQDNELATWKAWSNQYWPAKYLIDAKGHVRYTHFGEGDYDKTEAAIRALLAEAGDKPGAMSQADKEYDPSAEATPETYLGAERAERFLPGIQQPGVATYTPYDGQLPESHFSLGGRWNVEAESATAGPGATLRGNVTGKDVYLVLSGPGTVEVSVDGKVEKTVVVTAQRLYHLLSRPTAAAHDLLLRFSTGVAGYAFTFG